VKKEIDKMLSTWLIFLVDEVEWVSLIIIQDKKDIIEIRVCVDYRSLNNAYVHDPFSTLFSDEGLDNVTGNESYSFIDGFFGHHQVKNTDEDKKKTTFTMEWGSYAYHAMPFRLKDVPMVFSRTLISTFRDYIHRLLEVYMDDWTIYSLLKKHSSLSIIMFDQCKPMQIPLN